MFNRRLIRKVTIFKMLCCFLSYCPGLTSGNAWKRKLENFHVYFSKPLFKKYLKEKYYWLDIRKIRIKVQIVLNFWAALYWTCEWYMRNTCMEVPTLPFLHHSISVRFYSMKYILQKKYLLCMLILWYSRAKIPGLES